MERIIVTGGAGFIGHRVCLNLAARGHDVLAVDNFTQLRPIPAHHYDYLKERRRLLANSHVLIKREDVRDYGGIFNLVKDYQPSRIIHLAAVSVAELATHYIDETIGSIVRGTANLISAVDHGGVDDFKRFTYISSSMVYGNAVGTSPIYEGADKRPIEPYGGAKLAGEAITESFCTRFDIPWTIVRPCAVYGPTDVNQRVIGKFLENVLAGLPIELHENGEARLPFTYVDDAAEGIVLATLKDEGAGKAFNINGGQVYQLSDLVTLLAEALPELKEAGIKVNTTEGGLVRPRRGEMSIERVGELLGYKPEWDLTTGLANYAAWMKGRLRCEI